MAIAALVGWRANFTKSAAAITLGASAFAVVGLVDTVPSYFFGDEAPMFPRLLFAGVALPQTSAELITVVVAVALAITVDGAGAVAGVIAFAAAYIVIYRFSFLVLFPPDDIFDLFTDHVDTLYVSGGLVVVAAALPLVVRFSGARSVARTFGVAFTLVGAFIAAVPIALALELAIHYGHLDIVLAAVSFRVFVAAAALSGAFVVAVAGSSVSNASIKYRRQGLFQLLFWAGMVVVCLGTANFSHQGLDMFVGLLTLVNAPFDWASLGLTRALLRRGLELGGWWPYLLGLADALVAAVIIALLAITTVIAVQTFDHLFQHSGRMGSAYSAFALGRPTR